MSDSPELRLNLDLFQLQSTPEGLEYVRGMAVNVPGDGQIFVDPQQEPINPASYGPAEEKNLVLGVDDELAATLSDGWVRRASLTLEDDDLHFNLREPFGSNKLAPLSRRPLGRAALVGLAEHDDLTLTRVNASWYEQTRVLYQADISTGSGELIPYAAKIILLGRTGFIDVAYGSGKSMEITRLKYDYDASILRGERVDNRYPDDDDQDDEGGPGDSHDPEPRQPLSPLGASSVALKPPIEPEPLDDAVTSQILSFSL